MRRNRVRKGAANGEGLFGLVIGLLIGAALGGALVDGQWSESAAKGGNAHYDPMTGKYQWDGWTKDLTKKPQGAPSGSEKE